MKPIQFFLVCHFFSTLAYGSQFSYLDKLLSDNVITTPLKNGGVQTAFDYEKALNNELTKGLIQKQSLELQNFKPSTLNSKNEANAFWINAYNFFMLATVLDRGSKNKKLIINSVKDRKDGFGTLFNKYKVFQSKNYNIGGRKYSLDQMEKEQLLGDTFKKKGWKDARVHFAVNCASVGCPPLLNRIYTAKTLDKDLSSNVKKSLLTHRHLHLKKKDLYLTHLFKWYKNDFTDAEGSVKSFIKKYTENERHDAINKASINYIPYNWNLNKPENFK